MQNQIAKWPIAQEGISTKHQENIWWNSAEKAFTLKQWNLGNKWPYD